MKIAQITNMSTRVPPRKYGGTERIIYALTEELVRRGHEVTLFASGDSATSAKLVSVYPKNLSDAKMPDPYGLSSITLLNIGTAYGMQDKFDIIHDHNWLVSLPTANQSRTPVVMTLHGAFDLQNRLLFEKMTRPHFVTISRSQAVPLPQLPYAGVVYNGLHMRDYPFSAEHDGYLLFVGRASQQKGTHHAIDVAQYLNLPLIIAGKVDAQDISYFKERIEPRLSDQIRWVGEVNEEERNRLMSRAMCFLHPIDWREPFGLVMIEAMATGCPVIAFKRGSAPELIKQGETGFLVEDVEEMVVAVQNIHTIKRENCRKHALENFNAERMADGYEAIYKAILEEKLPASLKTHTSSHPARLELQN